MEAFTARVYARFSRRYRVFFQYTLPFMRDKVVAILAPKSGPGEQASATVLPVGAPPAGAAPAAVAEDLAL